MQIVRIGLIYKVYFDIIYYNTSIFYSNKTLHLIIPQQMQQNDRSLSKFHIFATGTIILHQKLDDLYHCKAEFSKHLCK